MKKQKINHRKRGQELPYKKYSWPDVDKYLLRARIEIASVTGRAICNSLYMLSKTMISQPIGWEFDEMDVVLVMKQSVYSCVFALR